MAVPILGLNKETSLQYILKAAATDNWHDFHHADSRVAFERLGKSYNIQSNKSLVAYQREVLKLRQKYIGSKNIYNILKDYKSWNLLLDNSPEESRYGSEEAAFNAVLPEGVTFTAWRQGLIEQSAKAPIPEKIGIAENMPIAGRPYSITAAPAYIKGVYKKLPTVFSNTSNGFVNYILMIDASNLSMSKLRGLKGQGHAPGTIYNFYIIESVENESDPAEKIGKFDSDDPTIQVFFLRDGKFRTNYTRWDTGSGYTSTLLSGCSISTYRRSDDTIVADITMNNGKKITIEDVGKTSEINEASFLALQALLNDDTELAMIYFLLKRAGDWLQGLCLLDRGRMYTVYDINDTPVETISLQGLIDRLGAVEIAALTHDKILASYLLRQGINVYLTVKVAAPGGAAVANEDSSTSVIWLLYLKNLLTSNPALMVNAATAKLTSIQSKVSSVTPEDLNVVAVYNTIASICAAELAKLKATNNLFIYFMGARYLLNAFRAISPPTSDMTDTNLRQKYEECRGMIAAPNYFSQCSQFETWVDAYLRSITSIKEFLSRIGPGTEYQIILSNASLPQGIMEQEGHEVGELVRIIMVGVTNIRDKQGAPLKPLQFFTEKTAPALTADFEYFFEQFPANKASILSAYLYTTGELEAIVSHSRSKKPRVIDMYTIFTKMLGVPQVGGNTEFDTSILFPIVNNKILQIRGVHRDYTDSTERISKGLNDTYRSQLPQPIIDALSTTAIAIYQREQGGQKVQGGQYAGRTNFIHEPELTDYIGFVISEAAETIIAENATITPETLDKRVNDIIREIESELLPYYTEESNFLDIGITVTYENGDGYTVVDKSLITNNVYGYWLSWISRKLNEETIARGGAAAVEGMVNTKSDNPSANIFLKYRFLIWFLDDLEITVNTVSESIVDNEKPYFTEDNSVYIRRLMAYAYGVREVILNGDKFIPFLQAIIKPNAETGAPEFTYSNFEPVDMYISRNAILKEIATCKTALIIYYRNETKQELDIFQLARLLYYMNPNIYALLTYLPDTKTKQQILPQNEIAKVLRYIDDYNTLPPGIPPDIITLCERHAIAHEDSLFSNFLQLFVSSPYRVKYPKLTSGGYRRRKRYARKSRVACRTTRTRKTRKRK